MDKLMKILEDICPDVDFENETALVDDMILSSFDILSIISEISDTFGITLSVIMCDIKPAMMPALAVFILSCILAHVYGCDGLWLK